MRSRACAQQRLVAGQRLARRVAEVGEQREVQVRVAVGEEAHLERLDQRVDALRRSASIVGTTTSVRERGRDAVEKSRRGSARGCTSSVATQLTSATASWLAADQQRGDGDRHASPGATGSAASGVAKPCEAIASGSSASSSVVARIAPA